MSAVAARPASLATNARLALVGDVASKAAQLGVMVLAKPTSRRLPQDGTWLELVRWCITGPKNSGSTQWARGGAAGKQVEGS